MKLTPKAIVIFSFWLSACQSTNNLSKTETANHHPEYSYSIENLDFLERNEREDILEKSMFEIYKEKEFKILNPSDNYIEKKMVSTTISGTTIFHKGTNARYIYKFYISGNTIKMDDLGREELGSSNNPYCFLCDDSGFGEYLKDYKNRLGQKVNMLVTQSINILIHNQTQEFEQATNSLDFERFIKKYQEQDAANLISKAKIKEKQAIKREEIEAYNKINTSTLASNFIQKYENQDYAALIPKAKVKFKQEIKREQIAAFDNISTSREAVNFIQTYENQDYSDLVTAATKLKSELAVKEAIILTKWQNNLNVGDRTFCGYIVEKNGPMLKIALAANVHGYGSEKWLHQKNVFYPELGCYNKKGKIYTLEQALIAAYARELN